MKKILIVGGSHSELPLVKEAKKRGLFVITTGNQKNGISHKYADKVILEDYSDKEAVLKIAKKEKIDYICFGAHDLSMISTSYVAEKLGINLFDDYDTTLKLHHKDRFKKTAQKLHLSTAKSYSFSNEKKAEEFANEFSLPFIVKPIDLGGGKGIKKVEKKEDIKEAVKNAFNFSKSKKIIIEEWFEGSLHSLSMFVKNRQIAFYYTDSEYPCKYNPYGVCLSVSTNPKFELIKKRVFEDTQKLINYLDLKDGLLHLQYLQNNDKYSLIEYTRRMPGDFYNVPVELSTGFEYSKTIIDFVSGKSPDIEQKEAKKLISRFCVEDEFIKNNSLLYNFTETTNKKGIQFFEFKNLEEFKKVFNDTV